jgi:hypothetical protein
MWLMLNTNVGDMPLDIYSDYVGDSLGIDFPWEYIVPVFNVPTLLWQLDETRILGDGYGYHKYTLTSTKNLNISARGNSEQYIAIMMELDSNIGNGLYFGYGYNELSEVNPEIILHTTGYGLFEFQNGCQL